MPRFALAAAALALAVTVSPASAKPPWVSIELPANPMSGPTRGAYLLVRTYHVNQVADIPLTGTATGMMDGKRQVIPLTFDRTATGVFALRRTWPSDGIWVLAINAGGEIGPTALVSIASGKVRGVNVPTATKDGFTTGRKVTQGDVDQALRELATGDSRPGTGGRAAAFALALLPVGIGLLARRVHL